MIYKIRGPDLKKEQEVNFWLETDDTPNKIKLKAQGENGAACTLLVIAPDYLYAPSCVEADLGLLLTTDGRIKVRYE